MIGLCVWRRLFTSSTLRDYVYTPGMENLHSLIHASKVILYRYITKNIIASSADEVLDEARILVNHYTVVVKT